MVTETLDRTVAEHERRIDALEGSIPKNAAQKTGEGHVHARGGLSSVLGNWVARANGTASQPHVEFNENALADAFMRLENRIGVGVDPLANTVLRIGMPTVGTSVFNQLAFVGTKTQTANNALVNFVNFSSSVNTVGFTGTDIRAFAVNLNGSGAGDFDEVIAFRLVNSMASDVAGDLAFISFPHPTPGFSQYTGEILAMDIGDIDDGAWLGGVYGIRIGDRGGRDTQPLGLPSLGDGTTVRPISQEFDTGWMLTQSSGVGEFYNVLAANTAFGANQAPTAFVDLAAGIAAYPPLRIRVGVAPAAPLEGDVWNDSTQKSIHAFVAGVEQRDTRTLFTLTGDTTVANSSTETSLIGNFSGEKALPANFWTVGKTLRFRAWGLVSYDATAAQTLTIRIRIGGVTGTLILATAAFDVAALTQNDDLWRVECDITCRTTGNPGTVIAQGTWSSGTGTFVVNPFTPPLAPFNLDTTAAKTFELTADWAVADPGDTITIQMATLEVLN